MIIILEEDGDSVELNYEQVNEVFPGVTIDNYDKIKFTEESIYSVSKIAWSTID
jgi:hypothetical protein